MMANVAEEVGLLLKAKKMTLGAVESATGGLISYLITGVPGSSEYFKGSVTSYSNEVKIQVVGVKETTIKKYGAVSHQVAEEMAEGGRRLLNVDICISDTGIAGPGGATVKKPLGLFYMGMSNQYGTFSQKHVFKGDREQNTASAADTTLCWLRQYLQNLG